EYFHDRLSPREPDDADVQRMMHVARQLGLALGRPKGSALKALSQKLLAAALGRPKDSALDALSQKLLAAANEKPSQKRGGTQWAESCEWKRLSEVVQDLATQIAGSWLTEERPTTLTTIDINADVKDAEHSGSDMQRWRMRAEEFLAMYVLLIVRD